MPGSYTESEWKLFQRHKPQMLEELSKRLNAKFIKILQDSSLSQYERYIKLFESIRKSDRIVGDCFDDWKRSLFPAFAVQLARHKLIPDELWSKLSPETRSDIERVLSRGF